MPNSTPVRQETSNAKANTRPSIGMESIEPQRQMQGIQLESDETAAGCSRRPAAVRPHRPRAPARYSRSATGAQCGIPPRPSARRMANSFCRAAPRASSRFATFTQAISSTNATAASSVSMVVRSPSIPNSLRGVTVAPMFGVVLGVLLLDAVSDGLHLRSRLRLGSRPA